MGECSAVVRSTRCTRVATVKSLCHTHRQQQRSGNPFSEIRKVRANGVRHRRDALGRKQCVKCLQWREVSRFARNTDSTEGLNVTCRECQWVANIFRMYRMSRADFDFLVVAQSGRCANDQCGALQPNSRLWHIDHDHACCPTLTCCGKCVKGILCQSCNTALGMAHDNPGRLRGLADYLEATR
jgi:hypothetical protein